MHRRISEIETDGIHRQDPGDLTDLMESIREVGLLHPIVVTPDNVLVAGMRRLIAFRELGRDEIPVTVADNLGDARLALFAERDENVCRLDMSPSEKVALGRALEKLERPAAAERKGHGQTAPGRPKNAEENFPGASEPTRGERTGKVYDLVGEAVGMSGPTYKRAKVVVEAADQGDPAAVEAAEEMDRTGKVTPAYEKVKGIPKPRPKPFAANSQRNRQLAEKSKHRIEKAVGTCSGLARGLEALKVEQAIAVASPEEIDGWDGAFKDAIKAIKELRTRLKEATNEA